MIKYKMSISPDRGKINRRAGSTGMAKIKRLAKKKRVIKRMKGRCR